MENWKKGDRKRTIVGENGGPQNAGPNLGKSYKVTFGDYCFFLHFLVLHFSPFEIWGLIGPPFAGATFSGPAFPVFHF